MSSKRAAARWLDAHVGQVINTVQTVRGEVTWAPGPRTLAKAGKSRWTLDGSSVVITDSHGIVAVTDDMFMVDWLDESDDLIHTTTYSVVRPLPIDSHEYEPGERTHAMHTDPDCRICGGRKH